MVFISITKVHQFEYSLVTVFRKVVVHFGNKTMNNFPKCDIFMIWIAVTQKSKPEGARKPRKREESTILLRKFITGLK